MLILHSKRATNTTFNCFFLRVDVLFSCPLRNVIPGLSVVTQSQSCPSLGNCTLKCTHGFVLDDLGCYTCQCQQGGEPTNNLPSFSTFVAFECTP